MAGLYEKIETLPTSLREEIIEDLHACQEHRPALAMVDSAKGITNFHSPNDIIVDASMPAMIRAGGKMWVLMVSNMMLKLLCQNQHLPVFIKK